MSSRYVIEDIIRSYEWFGHSRFGLTELSAFHRDYVPGREHYKENLKHNRFPKTWYVTIADAAVMFVKKYHGNHTCCIGINPRTQACQTKTGHCRRARESDIEVVTSFFFDIDPVSEPTDEQIADLELFLLKTEPYFDDLGILQPVKAFTGRGYHLLFAIPPVLVKEIPDIKQRQNQFRQGFCQEFYKQLNGLELKVDNTMDLCRLAKIYGTSKPDGKRVSRFFGDKRVEDENLRDYLLGLSVEIPEDIPVKTPGGLPAVFVALMDKDSQTRQLWAGTGKTDGDTSNTGYDFSLTKRCLSQGITDFRDLAAILALRPKGAVKMSGKGEQYIRLTIANAIK